MSKICDRLCNVCDKDLSILSLLSPVVNDEIWNEILNFYGFSENRIGPRLPSTTPVYICANCMEIALGRKLEPSDIQQLPFNLYFRLHYFYNVPRKTIIAIRRYMARFIETSPKFSVEKLQREVDFMNGVLMPFLAPECQCRNSEQSLIQQLSQFSDKQISDELKRRQENKL